MWLLALAPELTKTPPPSGGFQLPWIGGLAFGILIAALIGTAWQRTRRKKWGSLANRPSASAGNALVELNAILLPNRPTVEMVMKRNEGEDEQDSVGDGRP